MDNDVGEHWFDNWDQREAAEPRIKALRIDLNAEELMIVVPSRFKDGRDGPCHSDDFRKRFWTDVLKSLELSPDLLFDEARRMNEVRKRFPLGDDVIMDLEERIARTRADFV